MNYAHPALFGVLIACMLAATGGLPRVAHAGHEPGPQPGGAQPPLPIIFVHGATGSGAQYETQALRWASNGYPNLVSAIDRLSSFGATFQPEMDAFIDDVRARTGAEKVYIVAHSLGTALMNGYLNSTDLTRRARVAKYIAIDGSTASTCPGGVPCMGIWARGSLTRIMGPDHNARFPEQGHTESVGSAGSFAAQYRFFTGVEPTTTRIVPEPPGEVEIAGRVLYRSVNIPLAGATVQVWEVDKQTGARKKVAPDAEQVVDATGNWGPFAGNGQRRYEIAVIRPNGVGEQHFYYEEWSRSNYLIRLNIAQTTEALYTAIERSETTSTASIVRQREWWGNNTVDPTNIDVLSISTSTPGGVEDVGNIVNAATAPYAGSTIAIITFDVDLDGESNTGALVNLGPFLAGIDVHYPGSSPPNGVITFAHDQRREAPGQVIYTPNWASLTNGQTHGMTVNFRDWTQPPLLTGLGPLRAWIGLRNSDDVGTNFDLKAEVLNGETVVGAGQVNGVAGGGSGFGNAKLSAIPLALSTPLVNLPSGTPLTVRLSARITCAGRSHLSGAVRFWYNDAQAASRIDATIDGVTSPQYVRSGGVLSEAPGAGPRASIDKALDSKIACNAVPSGRPFTNIGSWTLAVP
jgi:pimeloyl-ACP methyl ester carboxylesterase